MGRTLVLLLILISATAAAACEDGETRKCGLTDIGACRLGTEKCVNGKWSSCEGAVLPTEFDIVGNTIDEDCDGRTICPQASPECVAAYAQELKEFNIISKETAQRMSSVQPRIAEPRTHEVPSMTGYVALPSSGKADTSFVVMIIGIMGTLILAASSMIRMWR